MPCFIYLCHVLYIYAMFYIFMSCFIYLCHVLYIYVNFNTCCITIHLCCTKISIFVVLSSLIYVVSTQIYVASTQQIYVASRFVSSSTFSITPYSEKLSSPAVASGPTYPTGSDITRHTMSNGEQISLVYFCTVSHGAVWHSHRVSAYGWRYDTRGFNP